MRLFFSFLTLTFSLSAFGGLRHLTVENLNLEYAAPRGTGTVDKIAVGLKSKSPHELSVERIDETLVVTTPLLEFTWIEPWKFLLEAEKVSLKGGFIKAGKGSLVATAREAKIDLKGVTSVKNLEANCRGFSEATDLENELLEICRESLEASADRFDVPLDLALFDVLSRLPMPEEENPYKNFTLKVKQGDFYLYFLAQVVVKAGLRAWGAIHYEDELKTLVVRVDLIKFGVLPVTNIVLRELRERIKDPRVEIKPPFIRVRIRE